MGRVKGSAATNTELRIAHIADLMRSLQWARGSTGRALAAEWRLSEDRVKRLAAKASKRVIGEVRSPKRTQRTVCLALSHVLRRALEKEDWSSVIAAGKTWAQIAGAMPAQKLDVTASVTSKGQGIDFPEDPRERAACLRALADHEDARALGKVA